MKLTASKTSTAGEMMLTEQNPHQEHINDVSMRGMTARRYETHLFSMLTDDQTLKEGQEVDREEYDEIIQCKFNNTWLDARGSEYADPTLNTRQILRRKAVAEKQAGENPKHEFYNYGQSLGIKINDLQRLMLLSNAIPAKKEQAGEWVSVEAIEARITYFESIHHGYEANQLQQALNTIKALIPPSAPQTK